MKRLLLLGVTLSGLALGSGFMGGGSGGGGGGGVSSVSGTSPIVSSGGATPAISIPNAAANGVTKGAAAFTAADFDAASGVISLDYTNAQASDATHKGFLSSTDWTSFNGKSPAASPTFSGTVTLPSGSVTSSAWDTGTSTLTSNGVAFTAKAPSASPTFSGTATMPSGSITSSAWDTGTSTLTSNGVAFTAKAPSASPTFSGTVTLPSGSVTSSAWNTGTSSLTSNGVAFTAKAPSDSPTFTGVMTIPLGSASLPSLAATGDATSGFFYHTAGTPAVTIGTTQSMEWNSFGMLFKNPALGGYAYQFGLAGSVTGIRIGNTGSGAANLELASNQKGWGISTTDATGTSNKWKFGRIDGLFTSGWFGEKGQVYWGGNTVGQKGVSFNVQAQPDISNVGGTTTANASTTITGSSTTFLDHVGIGDRISLSSAASTYATVTAIASNTSLTVDAALGDGTSQTYNVKRGITAISDASGNIVQSVNDLGKITLGAASTTQVHRLNTATGTAASDALTLLNGPSGKAGDPAVYIKININGTDRYIPAW